MGDPKLLQELHEGQVAQQALASSLEGESYPEKAALKSQGAQLCLSFLKRAVAPPQKKIQTKTSLGLENQGHPSSKLMATEEK